jgi:hypothetical protein
MNCLRVRVRVRVRVRIRVMVRAMARVRGTNTFSMGLYRLALTTTNVSTEKAIKDGEDYACRKISIPVWCWAPANM